MGGRWFNRSALTSLLMRAGPRRESESPVRVAQAVCEAEAWPWQEPVRIEDKSLHWVVETAPDLSGRRARIVIKKSTGQILCSSFIRRCSASIALLPDVLNHL